MKKIIILLGFACYSCGDKYKGEIVYKITVPSYMISKITKIDVDIDATNDRQAKIQFVTRATIYNNVSPDIRSQFLSGTLLKNDKPVNYTLEQKTIDSINLSINRITAHRNDYFNPYIQN